jgi:outer membrane receptor for ferrienterochelin and colicins
MHTQLKLILIIAAVSALMIFPVTSHAQQNDPQPSAPPGEEMLLFREIPSVSSASKYEQKVTEAPSSVSIVTASDIKKYGYRTLADILRSTRSFYVTYDRNYSYVGVRGFGRPTDYNNRMLLLIDGHRINDNLYDMAFVGTDAVLDIDLIDRVEIIRGPGSSLYGSNALFAVVNIITRRGRDLKGGEASGEAGSYDTYKGRLSYGNRYRNGLEVIASGTVYDSKGQSLYFREFDPAVSSDPRASNNGVANHADYDQFHSFFTKAAFRDFTLEGAYSSRTKGIPTASFGTDFGILGNKTRDTRGYVDLKYDHPIFKQTDLSARLFYDYDRYMGDYIYSGITNKDWGYGEWWGGELKLTSRPYDFLRVILGTEYTYNNRLDQQNYNVSPSVSYLDDKRRSQIMAAYIQGEISVFKWLSVTAGGRYDHYDSFGSTANPRLALIVTPVEKSIFKLLYGTAFRAPSPFELYYQSSTNAANPDLKPEKINTCEVVYEQYWRDHFRATAAAFYYKIDNLINQADDGAGKTVFKNIDQVESEGFELELENKWANGIEGRVSYTLQKTVDEHTHQILSNSPEHLVKLNIAVPLWKDMIFAGIEEQYTSRRKTYLGTYTSDAAVTNITIYSHRFIKGFELSASVYNLFDRKYADPVSVDFKPINTLQQDGRTYRFKLTYAF